MPSEFNVGDKVRLQLGMDGMKIAPKGLRRWDICTFIIERKVSIITPARNICTYYELKSCKSPMGVPYAIMEEWLVPIK